MDCSPQGSSVPGISQAIILGWAFISFSRGSSHPGIKPASPTCQVDSLPLSHLGLKPKCFSLPILFYQRHPRQIFLTNYHCKIAVQCKIWKLKMINITQSIMTRAFTLNLGIPIKSIAKYPRRYFGTSWKRKWNLGSSNDWDHQKRMGLG